MILWSENQLLQHAKWVSTARANEKFKVVSELKQIQYHATFLITLPHPHRHVTTSHHSRSLCSRCIWDAHCVLVYLLPKGLWFTCRQMPNLLGIPDLWILQIPSCQGMSPSLVLLVWHPCAFLPLVKCVHLHNALCKQELPTAEVWPAPCPAGWIFWPFVNVTDVVR